MIARWKWMNPDFQCSECRMRAITLEPRCPFCGAIMSNVEEVWIDFMKSKLIEETRNIKNENQYQARNV